MQKERSYTLHQFLHIQYMHLQLLWFLTLFLHFYQTLKPLLLLYLPNNLNHHLIVDNFFQIQFFIFSFLTSLSSYQSFFQIASIDSIFRERFHNMNDFNNSSSSFASFSVKADSSCTGSCNVLAAVLCFRIVSFSCSSSHCSFSFSPMPCSRRSAI